jgi:lactoylglutathione lyase
VIDPQGIAWEHFHTLGDIPVFGDKGPAASTSGTPACCAAAHPPRT